MFKKYYSNRFYEIFGSALSPSDGIGDEAVRAELSKMDFSVPIALMDYYSIAGNHKVNKEYNILRSLNELEWFGDTLIFMEENQAVAYWGIKRGDCNFPNPIVWQGQNINSIEFELEDNEPMEWYAEPYRISQFLMAMWKYTLTGEQEQPESSADGQ
jgi:hypothetical protein